MARAATEYIENLVSSNPEVEEYSKIAELYKAKLWHQLTVEIQNFIEDPRFKNQESLVQLYNTFIIDFEQRINKLKLTQIIIVIASQHADPKDAIAFLLPMEEKVKDEKEPYILLKSIIAELKLTSALIEECKEYLEQATDSIATVTGIDSTVNEAYYRTKAKYYKEINRPEEFYKYSLQYLSYAQIENVSIETQRELAFFLGLAALVGDNVYNFGELVTHAVVESLRGTQQEWMLHLLNTFNSGDVETYQKIMQENEAKINEQPALTTKQQFLRQKISTLSLMELVFKRPSDERSIPFQTIADSTQLPVNEVELLIMKALSLNLVDGSIDEVDQIFYVTWVQPRVLTLDQIKGMKSRVDKWQDQVQNTLHFIEPEMPEFYNQ